MGKLTQEDIQKRIQPYGFTLCGKFTTVTTPTEVKCHCGKRFIVSLPSLYRKDSRRTKSCGMCNAPAVGSRYNKWIVLKVKRAKVGGGSRCVVQCDCGTVEEYNSNHITSGHTQSCGHCNDPRVGDTFGSITILEVFPAPSEGCQVIGQCSCGNILPKMNSFKIIGGNTKTCGHCKDPKVGDVYNQLTVLQVITSHIHGCQVVCRCSCGNILPKMYGNQIVSGHTQTCGHCDDPMVGDRYGSLTITEVIPSKGGGCRIKTVCDCGGIWDNPTQGIHALRNGLVKSCGHCNDPKVGQKFGLFTITKVIPAFNGGCRVEALCECGNTWKGFGGRITSGWIQSCGCENSRGEKSIIQILNKLNIPFQHNKALSPHCRYKKPLQFDFILNEKLCIEYHGTQHYDSNKGFGEDFALIVKRDQIKRDYCTTNNILLYEIPYTYFDQLEELITELIETGKPRKLIYPEVDPI